MDKAFSILYESYSLRLSTVLKYTKKRFAYDDLLHSVQKRPLTILKGLRGVGKTVLLLQLSSSLGESAFYFSADHVIFDEISVIDFVRYLKERGFRYIFIDEIHTYKGWDRELKILYDEGIGNLLVSGSSALDLSKGHSDLSRRAILREIGPLSYREYIYFTREKRFPKVSINDILKGFRGEYVPLSEYMSRSLPFYEDPDYWERLSGILYRMLTYDLLRYPFTTSTISLARKILTYIARSPPGNVSISKISSNVGLSKGAISEILDAFIDMGLVLEVPPCGKGKELLRSSSKYYIVPPFRELILKSLGEIYDAGIKREDFFIFHTIHLNPCYPMGKGQPDFKINGSTFEIGGPSKSKKQIAGAKKGFVVKDLPIVSDGLPLYLFGYLR